MGKQETMIERVARAIALAALDDETRAVVDPDTYPVVDSYYDLARAAIEAMRDPAEAVCEAAVEPIRWGFGASDFREALGRALTAALNEDSGE